MMIRLGLAFFLLACAARAEEESYCVNIAKDYIAKHGSKEEERKFESKWKGMADTAANSTAEESEEKFLNRYIYDWMADRRGRFKENRLTVEDKLQACRLYLIYKNLKGDGITERRKDGPFSIPESIAKYLTEDNLKKYIADEKIEPKRDAQASR